MPIPICAALPARQLDLSSNQLCGMWYDFGWDGTYNAEGIIAIADALRVNGSLTKLDMRVNNLDHDTKDAIRKAVEGREGFALQL